MESLRKSATRTAPAKARGSGVSPRTAVKREKIVRSAAKLFLERGYEAVSINEIIAVVGGSKETIYSNFGNKAKLFEAVVQQLCSDVTINIDTRPIGSLEEQATRVAQSFVSIVLTPQIISFHRLVTSIGREFPAAGRLFYQTGPETVYRIFAEWIALHQKAGNIRADKDPRRLAILFHDMLIGEQILSWLTSASTQKDRAARIQQTVETAVSVFLGGCATEAGLEGAPRRTAPRRKAILANAG
ncbi:TetR/AcrR family transcriptional regulator [Pseudorhodoplanes sp.]|uniref:TetR/AcrR family transcriptional regulator n=1 Tax=Pseudorhodoplanes sp. TaxID=1934341 RepID=UPI002C759894|nr:TetR/AcrR family transcriptional regulator [Pseudorhodoplanes sp.]HWV43121.1 TetR/AcrR family transcriptional regulator [Pseudorhodoplanes sp.]